MRLWQNDLKISSQLHFASPVKNVAKFTSFIVPQSIPHAIPHVIPPFTFTEVLDIAWYAAACVCRSVSLLVS